MKVADFELERYFAQWEFVTPSLLCTSDVQPLRLNELLALADEETLAWWETLGLGYLDAPGTSALRTEIASLYTTVSPDDVYCFTGSEEGIFTLINTVVAVGDHAIVTWPGYQSLYELVRSAGADLTMLELERDAAWELDVASLRDALRPTTKLIVVNTPHNPTGALLDGETLREVGEIAAEVGAVLLCDEIYRLLEHDPLTRPPSAIDVHRDAVVAGSISKSFGLGGLRIGWIATRRHGLLERMAAMRDYLSVCHAPPSEVLAVIALRARASLLERAHAIVERNLPFADEFFAKWADLFEWVRPSAGPIAFPRLVLETPIEDFATKLREDEGVLILPGTVYQHPGNHFRLGFGRVDFPVGIERLDRFAARFRERSPVARGAGTTS